MTIQFSAKQAENITADIEGVTFELNEGTIRSGKTMSDCFKMARIYAQSPDLNHLVLLTTKSRLLGCSSTVRVMD